MRHRHLCAAMVFVAGVSLAACGPDESAGAGVGASEGAAAPTNPPSATAGSGPTSSPTADPGSRVAVDPASLLGTWLVTADSEPAPVSMTLGTTGVTVRRPCGELGGEWRASAGGLFVANLTFFHQACVDEPMPDWLSAAAGFEPTGAGVQLLDTDGAVVATLATEDGGSGGGGGSVDPEPGQPAPAASVGPTVPAGYRPATPETLVGQWLPVGDPAAQEPTPSYAAFAADRSWRGSDGCNGQGGRWVADATGALLATQGPQTLIGCRGVSVGALLQGTTAAAFDGDILVLLDATGAEVLRLHAAAPGTVLTALDAGGSEQGTG